MLRDPSSATDANRFYTNHIDLYWEIDFDRQVISGKAVLKVHRIDDEATSFVLDANALKINSVSVNGESAQFDYDPSGGKFGGKLSINIPMGNNLLSIAIDYETTDGCTAIQWLQPEYLPLFGMY